MLWLVVALTMPHPARAQLAAARDSTVRLQTDGWVLVGTLTTPPPALTNIPAVLLLNRAAGNRHAYDSLARLLARHGMASLRLDLRGHGESINRGRFVPGASGMDSLLDGTGNDIATGLKWLANQPRIDSSRLGVVGASYSGELAIVSAQRGPVARTYALLSPGSLSSESVAWLDGRAARWLLVASRRERTQATREVIAHVLEHAQQADVLLLEPQAHATQLLEVVPELASFLAPWLEARLAGPPAPLGRPAAGPPRQDADFGALLRRGMQLIYHRDGVPQPPWTVDSVRGEDPPGLPEGRCLRAYIRRTPTPAVEPDRWCLRSDSLYRWSQTAGRWEGSRPGGPDMRWSIRRANGDTVHYETGAIEQETIGALRLAVLPTIVTTVDSLGRPRARLRERFAPALLTATGGVFERPDSSAAGGWVPQVRFDLKELRPPPPP